MVSNNQKCLNFRYVVDMDTFFRMRPISLKLNDKKVGNRPKSKKIDKVKYSRRST